MAFFDLMRKEEEEHARFKRPIGGTRAHPKKNEEKEKNKSDDDAETSRKGGDGSNNSTDDEDDDQITDQMVLAGLQEAYKSAPQPPANTPSENEYYAEQAKYFIKHGRYFDPTETPIIQPQKQQQPSGSRQPTLNDIFLDASSDAYAQQNEQFSSTQAQARKDSDSGRVRLCSSILDTLWFE